MPIRDGHSVTAVKKLFGRSDRAQRVRSLNNRLIAQSLHDDGEDFSQFQRGETRVKSQALTFVGFCGDHAAARVFHGLDAAIPNRGALTWRAIRTQQKSLSVER